MTRLRKTQDKNLELLTEAWGSFPEEADLGHNLFLQHWHMKESNLATVKKHTEYQKKSQINANARSFLKIRIQVCSSLFPS